MKKNSSNITSQTANQFFVDFEVQSVFIFNNKTDRANLANASGGELVYPIGTVLAKSATGGLILYKSANTGVEAEAVGILAEEVTLADATNQDVTYVISGDVAAEQVVLDGSDTLSTLVLGISIKDHLQRDTYGIKTVVSTDLTQHDNS